MVNTKRKGETQYETPKPSKTPKSLLSKKKHKNTSAWQVLTRACLLVSVGVTNRD